MFLLSFGGRKLPASKSNVCLPSFLITTTPQPECLDDSKIRRAAKHGVLSSALQITKFPVNVCLHPGVSTFMVCSGSNLLGILFSIKILQYISINHVVALICHKSGISSINLGVSGLVPLKWQIYTISKGI
jgi:hypothetical protein